MLSPSIQLPEPRTYHRRRRISTPTPSAPTLVSATYDTATSVTLTFDRAVNIDAFDNTAVALDDGQFAGALYEAIGTPTLVDPNTVEITLMDVTASSVPDVRLTVAAGNGIVSAADATPWPGVSGLALPYP